MSTSDIKFSRKTSNTGITNYKTKINPFRILVVDDDPEILDLFRRVLTSIEFNAVDHSTTNVSVGQDSVYAPSLSFDLVTCRQGDEAVGAVKQAVEKNLPFSVAFVDIRMPPGPDGLWTAEKIRRLDDNVEILIMTAYSDAHLLDIIRRVPPVHKLLYLQKPFHIQEIYQFASGLSMKWYTERELQKLNKTLEHCIEARIRELKIVNKELQTNLVELQKTKSVLQESEGKLHAMMGSISDNINMIDKDLNIIWVNKSVMENFGENIIGKKCYEIYHRRKKPCEPYPCAALKAFEDGQVHEHEKQSIDKNGNKRFFHIVANVALRDENGNPTAVMEVARDITERKQAGEALRESEEKYRRLFESLVDVFYQADSFGKITMVSPSITKAAGYKPEEVIGSYLKDYYVNPDERNKFLELISTNGFVENFEVQMRKKDGSVLWASVSAGLREDQEGNVVGVEGIARDVTERINAEEELRETKERFRNLTETTSDWIWEVDKDVCYTYVSPKIYDILGYDPEEIIGKTPFDLMPPDEADRVSRVFNNIAASQQPFDCLENINIHKDGHPVILETSGVPIFGSDGKFSGYRGVDRDITERKEIEETLRQSEMRYRTLTENSMIGIWQIDLDGNSLYVNPAMCQMLEIKDHGELHGRTVYSFFDRENREFIKRELSKRKKGRSSTYQVELIGENGTKRNLMICGAPLYSSEGKIRSSIATCTDITNLKKIEKELKEARDELENKVYERTVELENALEKLKRDEEKLIESKLALELLNKELVKTNQAVSVLASNIDRKKEELEKKIYDIFTGKLMPILKNLQKDVHCKKREAELELIINYLNEIVHEMPLTHNISSCLTVQEMRIALLLKNGLTSQQIADSLCISLLTVKTHRRNIRKKLSINKSKINLSSYLKSNIPSDLIPNNQIPVRNPNL